MSRPRFGLIIGKFYPPHHGHAYLIETALAAVDTVIVLICTSAAQRIPVALRCQWLQEQYPALDIRILDQDAFDRHRSAAWIEATTALVSEQPDIIFSSEEYGIEYAELMHCRHVMVDRNRTTVPCSSRLILENPAAFAKFVQPEVLQYLTSNPL